MGGSLPRIDQLEVWSDHVRSLDKQEAEQKRDREKRERRKERKAREAFRQLLKTHRSAGMFHAKMRWREYYPTVGWGMTEDGDGGPAHTGRHHGC